MKRTTRSKYNVWYIDGGQRIIEAVGPREAAILAQAQSIAEGMPFDVQDIKDLETGLIWTISNVKASKGLEASFLRVEAHLSDGYSWDQRYCDTLDRVFAWIKWAHARRRQWVINTFNPGWYVTFERAAGEIVDNENSPSV